MARRYHLQALAAALASIPICVAHIAAGLDGAGWRSHSLQVALFGGADNFGWARHWAAIARDEREGVLR